MDEDFEMELYENDLEEFETTQCFLDDVAEREDREELLDEMERHGE